MKLAFVVCNEYIADEVLAMLLACDIDYYTRWNNATGKGHGTEPHLGKGAFGSTNMVLMIGFQTEAPLHALVGKIKTFNAQTPRHDDHVRLFQLPLEEIV